MKKFLVVLIFALIVKGGFGNPIIVYFPDVKISELYFNESGEWQLEISIYIPQELSLDRAIDSLFIESNAGIVRIKPFPINSYEFLIVIDQDDIFEPLVIDPDQDNLILYSYVQGIDEFGYYGYYEIFPWELNFGYPDSNIPVLLPGQSICYRYISWSIYYYKDNSPTLGFPNDTSDAYGYLKGRLFDINLNVVTSGDFICLDRIENLTFDTLTGYFTEKIFAKNYSYHIILQSFGGHFYYLSTNNIQINMEVDSTVVQDIYLLDTIVGVPEPAPEFSRISIIPAPNPCRDETNFFINIPDDVIYTTGLVTLYENSGKKIRSGTFSRQQSLALPFDIHGLPQGVYFYSLSIDNKSVKSGQLLVVR
ncbi:MAG: T9SS type A sorting domain-containing protein [Bacteroidetes bacterium]|nr:T9SS type A sorting domain-containing protein [Bacteroidota bacterium]